MVKRFRAVGEVYNVRERMSEENGISGEWDDYPNWYEYEMFLYGPNGEVVDSWDSLTETYNGVQKLTEAEAKRAAKEVEDDVKAGKVKHWFSRVPESLLISKSRTKFPKSKSRRKSNSPPISLGGVRG